MRSHFLVFSEDTQKHDTTLCGAPISDHPKRGVESVPACQDCAALLKKRDA